MSKRSGIRVELSKKEKEMEHDDGVLLLAYHFDKAQQLYNDILKHFNMESMQAKEVQKQLYLAKKELDEHPLVQEYMRAYTQIRKMYEILQREIFDPFNAHSCDKKR